MKAAGYAVKIGRALNRFQNVIDIIDYSTEVYRQTGKARTIYKLNGWKKCSGASACTIEPVKMQFSLSGDCIDIGTPCLGGQAVTPAQQVPLGTPPPGVGTQYPATIYPYVVWFQTQSVGDRATQVQSFWRGKSPEILVPDYIGSFVQLTFSHEVTVVETVDPFALPIRAPTRTPQPVRWPDIPYRQINPARDVNEQYQRGYYTSDDVRNRSDIGLDQVLSPAPTSLVLDVPPIGAPVFAPPGSAPPHSASRPRPRTKEKKLIAAATGAAKTLLNVTTESLDALNAVYRALPKKYQKPGASPQRKAELLYKHFDELDAGKAVGNLIRNSAQDNLFGKLGRVQAKANRKGSRYSRIQIGLGPAL
jgi:hypothetical protein